MGPLPPEFGDVAKYKFDPRMSAKDRAATRRRIAVALATWTSRLRAYDTAKLHPNESNADVLMAAASATGASRGSIEEKARVAQQLLDVFDTESLCGPTSNAQDVELYNGNLGPTKEFVSGIQAATVQIQWNDNLQTVFSKPGDDAGNVSGARWCTGTFIGGNRVITAGHCFEQRVSNFRMPTHTNSSGTRQSLSSKDLVSLFHVNFNYQVNGQTRQVRTPSVYPISSLVEFEKGGLDYAIVPLGSGADGQPASASFSALTYSSTTSELEGATSLTVVQHPLGEPKKVSAGSKISIGATKISYSDVDTLDASSGAGIVDQNALLIGVHTDGGCSIRGGGANSGIPLASIRSVSDVIQ